MYHSHLIGSSKPFQLLLIRDNSSFSFCKILLTNEDDDYFMALKL